MNYTVASNLFCKPDWPKSFQCHLTMKKLFSLVECCYNNGTEYVDYLAIAIMIFLLLVNVLLVLIDVHLVHYHHGRGIWRAPNDKCHCVRGQHQERGQSGGHGGKKQE